MLASTALEMAGGLILFLTPLVLGVASFWPANRGQRLALYLAAPSILFGLLLGVAIMKEGGRVYPGIWFLCVLYLMFGCGPVLWWKIRQRWWF